MGSVAEILAIVDPGVDVERAHAALRLSCRRGEMEVVENPEALPHLLRTRNWSMVLHCGHEDSDALRLVGRLRPELAIVTLDVDGRISPESGSDMAVRSTVSRPGRFDPDIDRRPQLSPRTVVWSAVAVAIAVSIGGWFLTGSIVSLNQAERNDLIANEEIEDLNGFLTAAGKNEED